MSTKLTNLFNYVKTQGKIRAKSPPLKSALNGNDPYNDQMAHKMRAYKDAGIDGIFFVESAMRGQWQEMIVVRIKQVLEGKLRRIHRHRENMVIENQV